MDEEPARSVPSGRHGTRAPQRHVVATPEWPQPLPQQWHEPLTLALPKLVCGDARFHPGMRSRQSGSRFRNFSRSGGHHSSAR